MTRWLPAAASFAAAFGVAWAAFHVSGWAVVWLVGGACYFGLVVLVWAMCVAASDADDAMGEWER